MRNGPAPSRRENVPAWKGAPLGLRLKRSEYASCLLGVRSDRDWPVTALTSVVAYCLEQKSLGEICVTAADPASLCKDVHVCSSLRTGDP